VIFSAIGEDKGVLTKENKEETWPDTKSEWAEKCGGRKVFGIRFDDGCWIASKCYVSLKEGVKA
jgi:hypothetical protein